MPNFTPNYNLEKSLENENYDINVFNANADKIDTVLKEVSDKVDNVEVPVTSVNNKTGAISLSAIDVGAVPTTRKVNSKVLSADITLSATDIKTTDGETLEEFKTTTNTQLDTITQDVGNIKDTATTPVELQGKDLVARMNQVFTSASNGKTLVANAVTNKGVVASESDTFTLLADKIGQIITGKRSVVARRTATGSQTSFTFDIGFRPGIVIFRYNRDSKSSGSYLEDSWHLSFLNPQDLSQERVGWYSSTLTRLNNITITNTGFTITGLTGGTAGNNFYSYYVVEA